MKIEIDETEYMQILFVCNKYRLIRKLRDIDVKIEQLHYWGAKVMFKFLDRIIACLTPAELERLISELKAWGVE